MRTNQETAPRDPLPRGSVLKSERHVYHTGDVLSVSPRCLTVDCTDERGSRARLKFYDGTTSVNLDLLKRTARLGGSDIIAPIDAGIYMGRLFAAYPRWDAESADRLILSPEILINYIIPQMNAVIRRFHQNGLLLRDICPEHILFRENVMKYCGFGNLAALNGAAFTSEPGYGQKNEFLAPENARNECRAASDYYALGVTLSKLLGDPPGAAPDSDSEKIRRLRDTPSALYTAEDKIRYLIRGLTLPDPAQRWGWGETRVWRAGYQIPWIQKNGVRQEYQFTEPFMIRGAACWNRYQMAEKLAVDPDAWTASGVKKTLLFLKNQGILFQNSAFSPAGTMFRCVYTLNPATDGFKWKGMSFADPRSLIHQAESNQKYLPELSQALQDKCFSFFFHNIHNNNIKLNNNNNINNNIKLNNINNNKLNNGDAALFARMEAWEQEQTGKGANRCLMIFARDDAHRRFFLDGRFFENPMRLLEYYQADGLKLRTLSAELIRDSRFQAWVWFKKPELNLDFITRSVNQNNKNQENNKKTDQNFFILLSLFETLTSDEKERREIRKFYLRWGAPAPETWLEQNQERYYRPVNGASRGYSRILTPEKTLREIRSRLDQAASDYRDFSDHTINNPFTIENGGTDQTDARFVPTTTDAFFCYKWEDFSVCAAFLRRMNRPAPADETDAWLDAAENQENQRLDQEETRRRDDFNQNHAFDQNQTSAGQYERKCRRNIIAALILFIFPAACLLFGVSRAGFRWPIIIPAPFCAAFPLAALAWYYHKMARIRLFIRRRQNIDLQLNLIAARRTNIAESRRRIKSAIEKGESCPCLIGKAIPSVLPPDAFDAPDALEFSNSYRFFACVYLLNAFALWMMTVEPMSYSFWYAYYMNQLPTEILKIFGFAAVYGYGTAFIFERKKGVMKSCLHCAGATAAVMGASVLFCLLPIGDDFLITGIAAPFVIALALIAVFVVIAVCSSA